jgi:hypothetical protein
MVVRCDDRDARDRDPDRRPQRRAVNVLTPDPKVVAIVAQTLDNAHDIVSAFNHVEADAATGFDLAACCAMAQEESGGRMIWGADPWNSTFYPLGVALVSALNEQPVTEGNYQPYKVRRNRGMQPQGCGITQLTSVSLQRSAERAGGCWVPFYNALIGFRFLCILIHAHGSAQAGFAAYNGSGPAAEAYGVRVEALRLSWAQRL